MKAAAADETITERFAQQRAHLEDLRGQAVADLRAKAELRRALTLDVHLSQAEQADLDALEADMAAKTADVDRIRESLTALEKREAADEAKAATAVVREREKELDGPVKRLGALGEKLADHVEAMEPLLAEVDALEREVVALASNLGRRFADGDRRRPLFSRLCCGRLGVKEAAFFVSPADLVQCEERLRTAPDVPAPGQREHKPDRGPVPFVEGDPEPTVDHQAEQTIAARKKQADLINANR